MYNNKIFLTFNFFNSLSCLATTTTTTNEQQLLEQQPFADADDSLFVEEEYGTVSALLGERAKPFLGIPLGPLQVGHFIGSLGILLMAFVEYPGFPLTNLPSPLRLSLQGGTCIASFRVGDSKTITA